MDDIKLSGLSIAETYEIVPKNTILLGFVGSIAHGTYVPSNNPNSIDDKDIMGICIAPKNVYLGLKKFEQKEKKFGEWDSVVYEIIKFFRLLLKQNPNALSLLWLQEKDYIKKVGAGEVILENREIFTSKEAYHSFVGYAHGQLHRMEHMAFKGYMGEKRKQLVKKFGYDVKNAAHLIRLLRMGIEYLTDGVLRVYRQDNYEIIDIKSGKWSLEKVKKESDRLFKLAEESYVRSELPPKPDFVRAEDLLMSILEQNL